MIPSRVSCFVRLASSRNIAACKGAWKCGVFSRRWPVNDRAGIMGCHGQASRSMTTKVATWGERLVNSDGPFRPISFMGVSVLLMGAIGVTKYFGLGEERRQDHAKRVEESKLREKDGGEHGVKIEANFTPAKLVVTAMCGAFVGLAASYLWKSVWRTRQQCRSPAVLAVIGEISRRGHNKVAIPKSLNGQIRKNSAEISFLTSSDRLKSMSVSAVCVRDSKRNEWDVMNLDVLSKPDDKKVLTKRKGVFR